MKRFLITLICTSCIYLGTAQNVGIGTTTPLARLHVTDSVVLFSASGGVVFSSTANVVGGRGRRMLWYPDKAAFRVGYVDSANWDKDSIGYYSFAAGYNSMAGDYSLAIGFDNHASNIGSAFGYSTTASGFGALSSG